MQSQSINTMDNSNEPFLIHPKKFVMWLFIVASIMLFAGFTSAYIVRRGEGNWDVFSLPAIFAVTTGIIIVSSVFIQLASVAARNGNTQGLRRYLSLAFLLGLAFCLGQWFGWNQLVANNVFFAFSNPSNSFVYVITGVHLLHVVGGMILMIAILAWALRAKPSANMVVYVNMCATYWHFVGILWIYLYLFLYLYR